MSTAPASYPPTTAEDLAWQAKAACRPGASTAVHPELFFPVHKADVYTHDAKRVCRQCPVRDECLTFALTHPVGRHGVWGGKSERERERMRRRWAA